ncbi:MAG TPA: tetratricopeptide repeat protein [Tepidisphaeraceae bacterium]|nr:tetratricopeptide repeat protein [Tepidisphaeraceae bacterium]
MTTPNQQPIDYRSPDEGDDASEKLVLTSPDAASSLRDFGLWAGVLVLFALTIYSPALRGEFLWDDDRHVQYNANLRSAEGLKNIWTKLGAQSGGTPQYYPLTHTTYWIEYQLFGQGAGGDALSPLVFHVTNVLLHAGAAVLLWFVLRRLRVPGAWLAAAVFAVHPVHAESVAWVSERKNVLSGVFMFAAILTYLKFEGIGEDETGGELMSGRSAGADAARRGPASEQRDWGGSYALALLLFICALLSKTVAASTPAVILLLLWWKRGRVTRREVLPLLPFFAIGIAMGLLTSYVERTYVIGGHYQRGDWDLSWAQRILIAGRAVWFYVMKLLAPLELTFTYPRWHVDSAQLWQWAFTLAAIAVTVALWAMRSTIGRAPIVAWLVYVGILVPALGFFDVYPMRYSFVADHFQYHASPALIALIVGSIVAAYRRLSRQRADKTATAAPLAGDVGEQSPTPYVTSAVVLLLLAVLTWRQSFVYADAVTLWRDTVEKNPRAWMAHHNLGVELTDLAQAYQALPDEQSKENAKDLLNEAVGHLREAVRLRPTHDVAIMHLGRAVLAQGGEEEALAKFNEALRVNPNSVEAMTNRGFMLRRFGKNHEAVEAYRQALALCEEGPASQRRRCGEIARLLGGALEITGRLDDAQAAYTRAIRFAPGNLQARFDLGTLLRQRALEVTGEDRRKRQADSADQFLEIIRRDQQHQDARISLALLLIDVGQLEKARLELLGAAQIDPQSPRLMAAAEVFSAAMEIWEASTQPSTTRASTQSSTQPPPDALATERTAVSNPPATQPAAVP